MLRILIVDDKQDTAERFRAILQLWGYQVRTAQSGRIALRETEKFAPDVVMIKSLMSGMDGDVLARHLREYGRDRLTILCLSDNGPGLDQRRCQAVGIDHHFIKPVDLEQLRRVLLAAG